MDNDDCCTGGNKEKINKPKTSKRKPRDEKSLFKEIGNCQTFFFFFSEKLLTNVKLKKVFKKIYTSYMWFGALLPCYMKNLYIYNVANSIQKYNRAVFHTGKKKHTHTHTQALTPVKYRITAKPVLKLGVNQALLITGDCHSKNRSLVRQRLLH